MPRGELIPRELPVRVRCPEHGESGAAENMTERVWAVLHSALPSGEPIGTIAANTSESVALLSGIGGHPIVLLPPALTASEIEASLDAGLVSLIAVPRHLDLVGVLKAWRSLGRVGGFRFLQRKTPLSSSPIAGLAVLCQVTSGSTGPSRLAVRPLDGVIEEADTVAEALDLQPDDRIVLCSSIAHSYALVGGLLGSLRRGAEVVLSPSAAEAGATVRDANPTVIFGLPTTYSALLESGGQEGLGRVRLALCAGAPLDPGVFEAFHQRTGIVIRQDYGTTETGTISLDLKGEPGPDVAGSPLRHVEVEVGSDGRAGEILVRSRTVAASYLEAGELVPCLDADGWYHTGDLGLVGEDGRIRLRGRVRDPVVIGGITVRLEDVEQALRRVPGVRDVVVLPMCAPSGDRALRAVVVAQEGVEEELRRSFARVFPPEMVPSVIEIRQGLPYSPAGKLLQKYL